MKKDWIENLAVNYVMKLVFDDKAMDTIADLVLKIQSQENTMTPLLKQQLGEINRSIGNVLNAIEQGIFTQSTKQRLEELEETKEKLETSILQEEIKQPILTKEQIINWLYEFRKSDILNPEHREQLIYRFINAIYLYDDKMILTFNYKDGTKTITLDDINSSSLSSVTAPIKKDTLLTCQMLILCRSHVF